MSNNVAIFAFTTSNYESMIRFFKEIGMEVQEEPTPLCPIFNSGRGAYISRGSVGFNIEESTSGPATASFNVWFTDGFTVADIGQLRRNGCKFTTETSVYGTFHSFKSPDGGTVMIST